MTKFYQDQSISIRLMFSIIMIVLNTGQLKFTTVIKVSRYTYTFCHHFYKGRQLLCLPVSFLGWKSSSIKSICPFRVGLNFFINLVNKLFMCHSLSELHGLSMLADRILVIVSFEEISSYWSVVISVFHWSSFFSDFH